MVGPVVDSEQNIASALGLTSTLLVTTAMYALCLFALPTLLISVATICTRWLRSPNQSLQKTICRFAWCLVPLGFAMWMAHYSFIFSPVAMPSYLSRNNLPPTMPAFRSGPPSWVCSCCRPAPDWLLNAELCMLGVGMLASTLLQLGESVGASGIAQYFAARYSPSDNQAGRALGPPNSSALRARCLDSAPTDANARHAARRINFATTYFAHRRSSFLIPGDVICRRRHPAAHPAAAATFK